MSRTSFSSALILEFSGSCSEKSTWKGQKIWWGGQSRENLTQHQSGESGRLLKTPQGHTGHICLLAKSWKALAVFRGASLARPCLYSSLMCHLYPPGGYATCPSRYGSSHSVFNYEVDGFGQGHTPSPHPKESQAPGSRQHGGIWRGKRTLLIDLQLLHVHTLPLSPGPQVKRSTILSWFKKAHPRKQIVPKKPGSPPYSPSAAGQRWPLGPPGGAYRWRWRCSPGKRRRFPCLLCSALWKGEAQT